MPRASKPDRPEIDCGCGCGTRVKPRQVNQRYATATCRRRADRQRRAAEAGKAAADTENTPAEHQLVKAMRKELAAAGVLDTYKGQLALQMGRQLVRPEEKASTVAQLSKEVDRLMTLALAAGKPQSGAGPAKRDEVAELRAERERLARDAAAGA